MTFKQIQIHFHNLPMQSKFVSFLRVYPFHVLPCAQCTLIICYRMRSVRLFFITVCAGYVNNLLPHAQSTLIICCRLRSVRLQSIKYLAILSYHAYTLTICYRMRSVRLQFATACAGYAYNLLPYAQCTLTKQLVC